MLQNNQYQTKGFGMQSNYTRPSKQTADGFGGEINNLITNQYEKDFLESKELKYKANISI